MSNTSKRQPHSDGSGRAYAGSQRQIQHYVNHEIDVLNRAIEEALNQKLQIVWTSPLESERYREYKDQAFMAAVGQGEHALDLKGFWPHNGPRWDATGRIEQPWQAPLLLEAKSHIREVYAGRCTATSPRSLDLIDSSLSATKKGIGVDSIVDWRGRIKFSLNNEDLTGCLYQTANRLAHLHFFREVLGIGAWLVNVCFLDDPRTPTSKAVWEAGLAEVKRCLGLPQKIPYCVDVFLPALV